jgi:transcription elongation factor
MNAPDLRLPPPCAPAPHLAATGGIASPVAATATPTTGARMTPAESSGNTQCSANTQAQTAVLPGLAPGVQ